MRFAHLHAHSTYSALDGYGTTDQIAARVVELGHTSCAQTDHGVVYGHVPWQKSARAAGIKPVFGCEFYVVETALDRTRHQKSLGVEGFPHITVLARTQEGYENFLRLVEWASEHGYYYKPRIDPAQLARLSKGLTVLTGCPTGFPTRYIAEDKVQDAYAFVRWLRDNCEDVRVEMVAEPGYAPAEMAGAHLVAIARDLSLPLVMTSDAHFPRPDDYEAQQLMLHIAFKTPIGEDIPIKMPPYQYYCSGDELVERAVAMFTAGSEKWGLPVPDVGVLVRACEAAADLADECDVQVSKAKSIAFPDRGERPADQVLLEWMERGIRERLDQGTLRPGDVDRYRERAMREYDVIARKGFSDYMLAISDICRWAKSQDTLVMCRGSAGGSLLLWLLGASETDSLEHDLSFERFYDDTRPDPPDVDVDFETWFRPKVFEYITRKYGEDHCAQILALSLLRAKVAVVDTAQALKIPRAEYEALAMALDSKDDDFESQLEDLTDPAVVAVINAHPRLRGASKLMGQVRQTSVHAAGMIVSAEPLHKWVAVLRQPGKPPVASVDKHAAADLGLLKFDLLSVAAFDVAANAARKVGLRMEDLYRLKFDDPKVYETAKRGEVVGVFQLDGAALKVGGEIGLDTFSELYAASALCRPGAMDFVGLYKGNKQNSEAFGEYMSKMDARAAAIIKPTYGVVLYQEQMMAMARMAGMDWPTVHRLRKRVAAASFNGHALGAEFGDPFLNGCVANGIPRAEAEHWWEAIKKHGIYCVSGDTLIDRGGSGVNCGGQITIAEYYQATREKEYVARMERGGVMHWRYTGLAKKFRGGKCNLLQMDIDGRVRPGQVRDVVHNGLQLTYAITTEDGHTIRVTASHRMMTQRGYVECRNLHLSDELVAMGDYERTFETSQSKWGQTPPQIVDAVARRADGRCESCGTSDSSRFEAAHMNDFYECDGDYTTYHSPDNMMYLCNSCHKRLDYAKGERTVRWSKGRPTYMTKIVSIEEHSIEDTYCVVMGTAGHNFVANGLVSHNSFNKSHCVTYAIVSYWMLWIKTYYPEAYYEAFLALEGSQSSPNILLMKRLVKEWRAMGNKVQIISKANPLATFSSGKLDDGTPVIVGGFANLHGVGERSAQLVAAGGPYATWEELGAAMPKAAFGLLVEAGVTGDMRKNVAKMLRLAPWFPVTETPAAIAEEMGPFTWARRPGEMPYGQSLSPVAVRGFVSSRSKKARTGSFKGEQMIYTLEDETGAVVARVSTRRKELQVRVKDAFEVGDFLVVKGWWTGEGVLFIWDFVQVRKWHEL